MSEHDFTNRLIHEKSPYLQQHAHNPVDWYPWCDEAFEQARSSNKPIFLSIGYATCHWCHVMERESFENEDIARHMNDVFVNIKVDREELPEVDALYMEFAQSMMSGAAGWPLNLVLTPELKPFFAATYLPPDSSQGLMGVRNLTERISEVWSGEERERVIEQATKIVEVFAESVHTVGDQLPGRHQVSKCGELFFKMADPTYGGMKGSPKFPIGYQANFLLAHCMRSRDPRALFLVERTLCMMQRGGIYDHLGGGFSRYSVDEKWLVPHFEKMLYDNALLAHAYLQMWQVSQNQLFKEVSTGVLDYVLRDMTHAEGGFFSAEDADTEGKEGLFYTWTLEEVNNILGPKHGDLFAQYYDVTQTGNFEGRNILNIKHETKDFAAAHNCDVQELQDILKGQRETLWQARERREHPLKDDKILSSWNGLMIHTLVDAGVAFNAMEYLNAAQRAARFIKMHFWRDGILMRRWRDGDVQYPGGLDEYAFLIRGCISLFEADLGVEWLTWAQEMCEILSRDYKADGGAFYQADGSDSSLILRKVQYSDGAEPSGNAVHCENLMRLYQLSQNRKYLEQAEDIFRAVKRYIDSYSPGYTYHLLNLHRYYDEKAPLFVVALNRDGEWADEIKKLIYERYIPFKAVVFRRPDDEALVQALPYSEPHIAIDGKTTVYICYHGVCQEPLNNLKQITEAVSNC